MHALPTIHAKEARAAEAREAEAILKQNAGKSDVFATVAVEAIAAAMAAEAISEAISGAIAEATETE